ncbi:MAG: hypothetical protein GY798_23970, partial [Hyphomicrobiales bacterium]|nr:hypothetical protein [Hyphomicrobiales bacterium]
MLKSRLLGGLLGGVLAFGAAVTAVQAADEPMQGGTLNIGLHIPLTTL